MRLVCVGSAIALLAACGGVDFASAGDAGTDSSVRIDAPGKEDAPPNGGDAGHDGAAKDAQAKDTGASGDTGTPRDTGTRKDTGTPGDTGTRKDTGSGPDTGGGGGSDGSTVCSEHACTDMGDCTNAPPHSCKTAACTAECCEYKPKALGTPCSTENGAVCDDNGNCVQCNVNSDCSGDTPVCSSDHLCVQCNMPDDCPASMSAGCSMPSCSGAGICGTTYAPAGTPCGPAGTTDYTCTASGTCCSMTTPPSCVPGIGGAGSSGGYA